MDIESFIGHYRIIVKKLSFFLPLGTVMAYTRFYIVSVICSFIILITTVPFIEMLLGVRQDANHFTIAV